MLRRLTVMVPMASSSSLALASATWRSMTATTRTLHTTPVVLTIGNNAPASSSNSQTRATADEDKEELDRERRLREQFAQKIQQGLPQQQQQQPGAGGPGWGPASGWGAAPGQTPFSPDAARKMFNFLFYLTALLFLMMMVPLANQNSPMYTMQGLPWWELPIGSAAYYLLLRALYSRREQNRIKTEFENAARANPTLTFDQFMAHSYPTMFQGYRTSQQEMVAAVSACLSTAKDFRFAQTMVRAAGRAADPRKSTDDVMDALRRDFPQLFQ